MPVKKKAQKSAKVESKKISQEEFSKKVIEFSKKGMTAEKIGETLRAEGIHPKEHNKKISQVLKENGNYVIPDVANIEAKLERLKKHFENNKQDKRAMRDKDRVFSELRQIKRYHKVSN